MEDNDGLCTATFSYDCCDFIYQKIIIWTILISCRRINSLQPDNIILSDLTSRKPQGDMYTSFKL